MGLILLLVLLGVAVAIRYGTFGERPRAIARVGLRHAFIIGGISFAVGYCGPIIWAPEANQGPLLGIFITGPLGFVVGFAIGVVRALLAERRPDANR